MTALGRAVLAGNEDWLSRSSRSVDGQRADLQFSTLLALEREQHLCGALLIP